MIWLIVKLVMRRIVAPAAVVFAIAATAAHWYSMAKSLLDDVGTSASFSGTDLGPYGLFLLGLVLAVALASCGMSVVRLNETRKRERALIPRLERVRDELQAFMDARGRYPTKEDGYDPNAGAVQGEEELALLAGRERITLGGKRALAAPRRPLRGPFGPKTVALLEDGTIVKRGGVFRIELFYETIAESYRDSFRLADFSHFGRSVCVPPICVILCVFFLTPFLPNASRVVWNGSKRRRPLRQARSDPPRWERDHAGRKTRRISRELRSCGRAYARRAQNSARRPPQFATAYRLENQASGETQALWRQEWKTPNRKTSRREERNHKTPTRRLSGSLKLTRQEGEGPPASRIIETLIDER